MARAKTSPGGRPRKFDEPSRPVTVTLPERTLRRLSAIDEDRARAIVKAADVAVAGDSAASKGVEIVEVEPGAAIILVGPSRSLRRIPFLRPVEVAPARYLLTIPSGTPVESLEIALLDVIEGLPAGDEDERALLEELSSQIRGFRRGQKMSKAEMLLVDTGRRRRSR